MKNEEYLDLLSVEGLGQTRVARLLADFGSAQQVFSTSESELKDTGIPQKIAKRIAAYKRSPQTTDALKKLGDTGGKIVTILDKNYPGILASSPQPPAVLFVRGELRNQEKLVIAMVGTRTPTGYGRAAAERLARELASRGVVIVSGAARGIDSIAHRACLAAGSRTTAVLGCGVDVAYPPENLELFDRIAAQGAVVSEFLPGTPPDRGLFPRRNRIIAWLSHGVVTVEAGARSGALITAHWAADAGRDVFAVPGGIFSQQSAGTNQLLKQGAKLVGRVEDILEEFGALYRPVDVESVHDTIDLTTLTAEEMRIYKLLGPEPIHVDNIVEKLGISSEKMLPTLLNMELKGLIKQMPGMRFVRVL